MAEGRDPIQDQLRRSQSLSLETSNSTRPVHDGHDSSVSMEGLNAADIDAIVNKKWMIDEVIGLVRSKLAILTGGRDKRGAPVITITCNEHSDVRPINVGKLLSYLSKAVDEPLQGKGFTMVLDMQKSSWAVTKNLLKSLQLTFVEHIHHVFIVKPKAFWQKRKVGVSLSMQKARYNFPVVLLDNSNGLLQYLPAPQVHKELGGSLVYNHDEWIDAQRCLEKHLLELKARLEGIESLREQLERNEDPVNLNEARDAVRRHVDARSLLDKGGLDAACEAAIHAVSKLKGCSHPDITDFFNRIDELCGTLQSTRGRLQQIWDEKGGKLDQVLQLRIFESDSSQLREWVEYEGGSLSKKHTDIGDSHSSAAAAKQSFADFNSRVKFKSQELKRVVVLGERLVAANHYAAEDIKIKSTEVKGQWDRLLVLVEDRESLLTLSMSFFDRQQTFFDNVEEWSETCGTKDMPPDIPSLEEAIAAHKKLQETFQTCYSLVREEGHKIIERLRKPVGDSSLPQAFVARTRVVKEILESMFDEENWLDEQWNTRNVTLEQTLHLRQYQKEAKEVYEWLENVGRPFLTAANSIGENESDTIQLLKNHDAFEKTTNPIYTTASQLFTKATHLAKSGQCKPELIQRESSALEGVVNSFALGLDTQRETILQAQEVFKNMEQVLSQFDQLTLLIPRSQFISSSTSDLELSLSKYSDQHTLASSITTETYTHVDSLLNLLKTGSKVNEDKEQGAKVADYSDAIMYLETRVEGVRRDVGVANQVCERRERLWNLSIQFNQLGPDVDEHIMSLGSWTQEQENWEWEPASNLIDAQLQLDAFQRQYNQFVSSHDELVTRGQSVAKELAELDMLLFGETGDHFAVKGVDVWVGQLEGACQRMRGVAGKKMEKLKSCLQFHVLQERATQLTSELTTLSSSLALVSGVGETLEKAEQLKQQAIELSHKSETVASELEQYQAEVEECVKAKHYQATSLKLLAKSLHEKRGSVSSSVEDKLTLVTAAVEFHLDVKNLFSSVDQYELQVHSEDTITSLEDVDGLVRSSNELHTSIQELASVVKSSGIKLGELVMEHSTKHPSQKTFSLDFVASPILSKRTRTHNASTNDIKAEPSRKGNGLLDEIDGHIQNENKRKSWDVLDSKHAETIIEEEQTLKTTTDSPKLLVAPRRARAAGMKAARSMPALGPSSRDHDVIDNLLEDVSKRASVVEGLWSGQIKELEQLKEVVGYREDVLRVLEWVESVGDKFLERKNDLGRSIEEVKSLIAECKSFADKDVTPFSNLVSKLDSVYQALAGGRRSPKGSIADKRSVSMDPEAAKRDYTKPISRAFSIDVGGQRSFSDGTEDPKVLQEVCTLHSTLESKWGAFEKDFKRYSTKMDLSLKFNEVIFEASNWCQMTQQFLDKMEDKVDLCTSAPKAKDLIDELDVYMSATNDQQSARLEQLKHTSEFLRNNTFKDLTNQVARSTSRMLVEVETCERNLKKMAARFTQIENDRDRERRLTNKREHVMEELLQTEVSFVADLKLILKCRPRFMRADMLPNSLKGKEAIIFGNINEIEAFHRMSLLPGLQKHPGEVEDTAHLFVEFADKMQKIYVPFCRDKSASEELLTSHRSYLNRVQSLFVTDTPLSTLLIKPVQRITKYPLLLKDLLKYTGQLGEPTSVLEEAVRAVERIPVATNNALHLSYLENSTELVSDLGELVYQSTLLVSDSKFGIKAEKERQVFGFERALLFARKVESDRQKNILKYELKSKLAISSSIQIVEFIEGEPCKFALVTADNRLHLKSSSVDIKQDWVRSLRETILETNTKMAGMENGNGLLSAIAKDLMNPSPFQSPVGLRKSKSQEIDKQTEFEKYIIKENFHPPPLSSEDSPLSLKKGDIVEVLDDSIDGKWFIRTQPVTIAGKMNHGWVPSSILEKMDTDSIDGKKGWVQITAGPLSGSSDDDKWKALRQNKTGFGSRDVQSQQVISALKKVTFGNETKDEDEDEGISLDKGRRNRPRSMTAPEVFPPDISVHPPSLPELNRSHSSPNSSPKHTNSDSLSIADAEGTEWTKIQWRKKVIKRKKSDPRSVSVSSDISEMGEVFHDEEKLHTSSSEETMDKEEAAEMDAKKVEKAHQKLEFILTELLQTEKDYLGSLERLINGYLKEMQSPNLPDSLKGKEKLIFGNIQEVFKFHDTTFLSLLEESSGDVEKTASCFAEYAHQFEVYVTYCENKPKSESFIWTYHHTGGTFFEEVQTQLGHKQGINSFLIRPVQRITKYKLLLSDLHKTAKKAQLDTPILEKALSLMEEIPKRANDAMTLSMICGYDGNIHSYGQLIAHDEFTVYERSRRTAAKRHVFLQDQRLILTKEKDADGMYVFKDALKIHSLSVAEKEGDNPCRFAVGTGSVESWEQYYVLEAATAEKKEQWVQSIKEILKGQFELLKALQGPRPRSKTFDVSTQPSPFQPNDSVAMINVSDDSEQEDEEYQPPPTPKTTTFAAVLPRLQGPTHTVAEPTPSTPPTQTRPFNLYLVAEDCAPPKDNEGIMYVRRGQIYDILDSASDWWLARLIKTVGTEGERVCEQGWVPGSFLDKYEGKLSPEEEAAVQHALQQKRLRKLSAKLKKELSSGDSPVFNRHTYNSSTLPARTKANGTTKKISPKRKKSKLTPNKVTITSSLSFQENTTSEPIEKNGSLGKEQEPKGPEIVTPLSSETVIAGRSIQLKCEIKSCVHPAPNVTWSHDGIPLSIDRAFTNCGEKTCVLKINDVQRSDEGQYSCNISNKIGLVTSTATLTVLSHPEAPGQPRVRPLTSSSVALSWDAPLYTGNSTITMYLVECKDTLSDRWSTIMKRITEPSAMIDDLVPGSEYVFRVIAGNQIGSSEPSAESAVTQMASPSLSSEFSLNQFDDNYELLEEIGRGRYGMVYKCLQSSTHQVCAAKLLPLDVGRDHAQHELSMLGRVAHPNLTQMMSGYLTQTHYIILFQLIPGVNLFEFFTSRDSVSEAETAVAIGQVVGALCYLHQANIAHLDIKPENIMAVEVGESNVPEIKLVHLERSKEILPDTDVIVTRLYEEIDFEAPEVLLGQSVSMETDMWSLGAVLYTLLTGSSPFLVDSQDLTKENIVKGRVSFPNKIFKSVSGKAKELLTQLLVVNKNKRLSSSKCQSHAWLNHPPSNTLDLQKLKDYMSSRKWQNTDNLKTSSYTLL